MMQLFGGALGQVLLVSILVGAGLPALVGLGIRALAVSDGGSAMVDDAAPRPALKVIGYLCFAVAVSVVVLGLIIIISSGFGYHVSFANGFSLVKK
ncbi:MAG TPA: hypothetical protein VM429_09630 [Micropruina sp.]|jgi:hypothetical protein|nr:hypothetical protein [Micropruina sp.]